ncbi:hypothetical protein ASE23_29610 [Rhizobium sp. Root73]|uniref:tetratricopeptide repeat protein n=1 Tax=unclassified Rhizobium TaxID=2613769 RepID=UPI0007283F2E|nr:MULTISPECIES: hypothetical protein [unclassified Rhizobium]KQY07754.1 hypothetical protein ASD36_29560 [Rhizobium sp. Root1334]KRC02446.1 hypothetical protein ASE23_29610 [Rhizobium sp. Root73]
MRWFNKQKFRVLDKSSQFDRNVRMGDEANALRQWSIAAKHYELALSIKPDDGAILIQYGHSLKEQHFLQGAEKAYRSAVAVDDANADGHLHVAHVSKLQDRMEDAIASYKAAARLGGTTSVGEDARSELSKLGVKPPVIITVNVPLIIERDPSYAQLVSFLKHHRLKQAYEALLGLPMSVPPEIKLIEAQLLYILGKYDEAIALLEEMGLGQLPPPAFAVWRTLYDDHGDTEKGIRLAITEITQGLQLNWSFETMSSPIDYLARTGNIEAAFNALEPLFRTSARDTSNGARTAADMKKDRGSSHFPKSLALKIHEDLLARAKELEAKGERAQATLLREEAEALRPDGLLVR